MSITGESFDYGPFAWITNYDLRFTAAYFDDSRRYCYGNQPGICRLNLEALQKPLKSVIAGDDLDAGLADYESYFQQHYQRLMLQKLGFEALDPTLATELMGQTLRLFEQTRLSYPHFFVRLRQDFSPTWRDRPEVIPSTLVTGPNKTLAPKYVKVWQAWRDCYQLILSRLATSELEAVGDRLQQYNPITPLTRQVIEAVWGPIVTDDDWQPFNQLVEQLRTGT